MSKLVKQKDSVDLIIMDVPLLLRMLEYAKEDAKTDMDLHYVTEKLIRLTKEKGKLSMDSYDEIVSKKVDATEQTMADAAGSFETRVNSPVIKRKKISKIPNYVKEQDLSEITGADVSAGGVYDAPFGLKGNPLKINGPKSIGKSRAVNDKKFPKWGGPGGIYIKIKDKCKKFPYCNQGDINAIEILREIDELNDAINYVSEKHGISREKVENIVLNEIKKIII